MSDLEKRANQLALAAYHIDIMDTMRWKCLKALRTERRLAFEECLKIVEDHSYQGAKRLINVEIRAIGEKDVPDPD